MKKVGATLLSVMLTTLSVSGCGVTEKQAVTSDIATSPREGWVVIEQYRHNGSVGGCTMPGIMKRCDGTTLLYVSDGTQSGGITAIRDSPECQS